MPMLVFLSLPFLYRKTGGYPNGSEQSPPEVEAMNRSSGPPITLGNAAAAQVRFSLGCCDCGHRAEPDPTEKAQRY